MLGFWAALASGLGGAAQAPSTAVLTGRVRQYVSTCCGGAFHPDSDECVHEEGFRGEIVVRRGRRNRGPVVARVRPARNGSFSVPLPPGVYCLLGPDRAAEGDGVAARPSCPGQATLECDAVARVPGPTVRLSLMGTTCPRSPCSGSAVP